MKRRPPHITVTRRWPKKYFGSEPRKERERVLLKRKRTGSFLFREKVKSKRKSKWTLQFHKVFPGVPFDKIVISKITGIPRSTLNTVYNRGRRAWQTSGSRPGTTANQWGTARVYKFVLVTLRKVPKSWYATKWDPDNNLR